MEEVKWWRREVKGWRGRECTREEVKRWRCTSKELMGEEEFMRMKISESDMQRSESTYN